MKRFALVGMCVALAAVGLMGCNWETGSDADSWSSSYNWVNFSGTYRGASGGLLVTDYTTTPATPGSTNTIQVTGESTGGNWTAGDPTYNGTLNHANVVAGSVTITLVGFAGYSDSGHPTVLGNNSEGNISYETGSWNLDLGSAFPTVGDGSIKADYAYTVSNEGSGGGAESGATRVSIYSFNVTHTGQNLTIVDNTGATYAGYIKEIRSASGAQNTDIGQVGEDESANDSSRAAKYTYYESDLPENGDTIIATFECSGTSSAGLGVKIVGTLQGTVAAGVFTGRTMNGTWIETGGKTGDIYATTGAVVIPTTPETPTDTNTAAMAISP